VCLAVRVLRSRGRGIDGFVHKPHRSTDVTTNVCSWLKLPQASLSPSPGWVVRRVILYDVVLHDWEPEMSGMCLPTREGGEGGEGKKYKEEEKEGRKNN
jgi:hypothetical protein